MKDFITQLGKDGLKSAYSLLEGFALYLTLAIIVILAVAFLIVKFKAPQKMDGFKSLALGIVIGYAVTLTACISFFMVTRLMVKGEIDLKTRKMLPVTLTFDHRIGAFNDVIPFMKKMELRH